MPVPESNYASWLKKAENDLLNIENNLSAERTPWDTVCFHAQQAAEKYLKAYLAYHGVNIKRTHDLVALLSVAVEFDKNLRSLEQDCRRLTYYAVSARYPDDLYEPGETDAREMIEANSRVREAIISRLADHEDAREDIRSNHA